MFDQLKNLKQLAGLMGNAGELKEKFDQVQQQLAAKSVEADAGSGAVRVRVDGKLKVLDVQLDPALLAALHPDTSSDIDRDLVQRLIVEATNAAMTKAQSLIRDEMAAVTGGMDLPGLDQLMP